MLRFSSVTQQRLVRIGRNVAATALGAGIGYAALSLLQTDKAEHHTTKAVPAAAAAAAAHPQIAAPAAAAPVVVETPDQIAAAALQAQEVAYLTKHRLNEQLQEVVKRAVDEQAEDPFAFLANEFNARAKAPAVALAAVAAPVAAPAAPAAAPTPAAPAAAAVVADVTQSSPLTGGAESDAEEDAAFETWKATMEAGFSAEVNPDSGRPHVRNVVASELESVIDNRDEDVLLQIYAPWCGACKMMQPVVDSVAQVMHDVEQPTADAAPAQRHLSVLTMDGDANVRPGFLTAAENRALPLLKFFPKCGSLRSSEEVRSKPECQAVLYQGRPNVQDLVEFVHTNMAAQTPPEAPACELERAHALGAAREPATRAAVTAALVKRFESDANDMPALKLHEIAPCGNMLNVLMKRFMLQGYTSYIPSADAEEAEGLAAFTAYRECTEKEETKLDEFWAQVKKQADEAIEASENKKKEKKAAASAAAAAVTAATPAVVPAVAAASPVTPAETKSA